MKEIETSEYTRDNQTKTKAKFLRANLFIPRHERAFWKTGFTRFDFPDLAEILQEQKILALKLSGYWVKCLQDDLIREFFFFGRKIVK